MTVWLAAFALGALAAALLPLTIFCASYLVLGLLAAIATWLSGAASLHGVVSLVLDFLLLQIGYGFGFAALAALNLLKNRAGVRKAGFDPAERRLHKGSLRERLDRRWHDR